MQIETGRAGTGKLSMVSVLYGEAHDVWKFSVESGIRQYCGHLLLYFEDNINKLPGLLRIT